MLEFLRTRVRWLLIIWIFVVSAIAYLDRVNISIAGKSIAHEFGLSNVQLGWVFSSFLIGYAFFQAPAGRIADRYGPRLVLMLGVIWWAIFTVAITVLSPHASHALIFAMIARFLLGIGEAIVYPASNCVVAAWIPSSERGFANGLIFSGVGFGSAVASPVVTAIMIRDGWRAAFYVSAIVGLVGGAVWYLLGRNSPREHPWVTEREAEFIEAGLPKRRLNTSERVLSWSAILTNGDIWAVTLSYFAYGYSAQIFFSWFFIYLSEARKLNLRQSSYFTMLPFAAMALASLTGGLISDALTRRFGKRVGRCAIAVVGMGLAAVFIALGTQTASASVASVILAGGAGALYLSQSSFWSVSADIGGESAGSVSGFMNMGGQLGGTVTASLTPAIAAAFGWSWSFLVAAVLCGAGALAWLFVSGATTRTSAPD